jgi:hypothetical protein
MLGFEGYYFLDLFFASGNVLNSITIKNQSKALSSPHFNEAKHHDKSFCVYLCRKIAERKINLSSLLCNCTH